MSIVSPRCLIKPKGKVIAVDIDEVLCPFLFPLMKWKKFTPKSKKYPYHYSKIMDISEQDSQKMVQEFYNSEDFAVLKPLMGAQAGIAYLKNRGHKLYAVTGRQTSVHHKTEAWLNTYFPYAFDDLVITNSFTPYEVPKSDICRSLNIGLIIDDNLGTCMDCECNHIHAVNFVGDPVYPWCEKNELSVQRWDDIICSTIV
tara:strand:- start:579 stop:1178 length:600 start_codon:yes stop_codon:yes gene_type:complete